MELKEFQNKDIGKVIQFAIKGMHFDLYLKNRLLLNLYGRYFWYEVVLDFGENKVPLTCLLYSKVL